MLRAVHEALKGKAGTNNVVSLWNMLLWKKVLIENPSSLETDEDGGY
jgi:hypothetical protein